MKKLASFSLIVLAVMMLAGCGTSATPSPAAEAQAPASEHPGVDADNRGIKRAVNDDRYSLQFVCFYRSPFCDYVESVYVPRVAERTNGRLELRVTSSAELDLSPRFLGRVLGRGVLEIVEVPAWLMPDAPPEVQVMSLRGITSDARAFENALQAAADDLTKLVNDFTGGVPLFRMWYPNEAYFWSKEPLRQPADFRDKYFWVDGIAMGDMIEELGGRRATFVRLVEVPDALDSGVIDVGACSPMCGFVLGLPQLAQHVTGPFAAPALHWVIVDPEVWSQLPPDLQQTLLEVSKEFERDLFDFSEAFTDGEKAQAESLGVTFSDLTPSIADAMFRAARDVALPNWIQRVGGPGSEGARIWNEHFAPRLGLRVKPDGSIVEVPVVTE